jgi:hypothetical protein
MVWHQPFLGKYAEFVLLFLARRFDTVSR